MKAKFCLFSMILAFTIFIITSNVNAVHPNLIAAWIFDEGKGETVADIAGKGHKGTIAGKAQWADGKRGSGLKIKDNTQYVSVEDANDLHFDNKDISFTAWINIEKYVGSDSPGILSKRVMEAGNGKPCYLWIVSGTVHALEIQMRDNVGAIQILTAKTEIKEGQWYYVAFVKNSKSVSFYVNGVKDATLDHGLGGSFTSDQPLYIGVHHYGTVWNCSLSGTIDEVGVYNKALSDAEVISLMQSLSAVKSKGKMVTLWGRIKSIY